MADGGTFDDTSDAAGPTGDAEATGGALVEIEIEESAAWIRALFGALVGGLAIGIAAGAAGGFALLVQDDEFRGASFVAALIGALLGAVAAFLPALAAGLVIALAAQRCRSVAGYRRCVTATCLALALLIVAIGAWLYWAFSYDLRDDDQALAVSLGVAVVVAQAVLIALWRSWLRIRDDEEPAERANRAIPNPFTA